MAHAAGHQHHANHSEHSSHAGHAGEGHHQHRVSEHDERTPEHWEELYSEDQVWSGHPNQALVAEVGAARNDAEAARDGQHEAGRRRALDVGCGEGADSVWLASQGWDVTALDISGNAVAKTLRLAEQSGVGVQGQFAESAPTGAAGTVAGVAAAFMDADLPEGGFDLVSAMYPVLEGTEGADAERKLLSLVAPGGTLLFVHHEIDAELARERGFDPSDFVSPADMASVLERAASASEGTWRFEGIQRRDRRVTEGKGAGHVGDLVVRATRVK